MGMSSLGAFLNGIEYFLASFAVLVLRLNSKLLWARPSNFVLIINCNTNLHTSPPKPLKAGYAAHNTVPVSHAGFPEP